MTSVSTFPSSAEPTTDRPLNHFTAERMWINDPNGLIHHNGLYHLYFQANPYGADWGNMSWGHATSPDLLNWTEHPVALLCDENEEVFSGSVVFDVKNSSRLGTEEHPPLVAIYTSAYTAASPRGGTQAQSLAYSIDGGYTWTKYENNPVLSRDSAHFRDPKVFGYEGAAGTYWVMAAVEAEQRKVVFYRSHDLMEWEYLSSFGPANATGGVWECPDLFPLPLDGDPGTTKWVLTVNLNPGGPNGGSAGQYFVGHFDGVFFMSEATLPDGPEMLSSYDWLDWGRDYYAAVSFNDAPDGRRIMIGWMSNWDYAADTPTAPWRGQMSLPRDITLVTRNGRPRLVQRVAVDDLLRGPNPFVHDGPIRLSDSARRFDGVFHRTNCINAEFRIQDAKEMGLLIKGLTGEIRLALNPIDGTLRLDRMRAGDVFFNDGFASVETAPIDVSTGSFRASIYLDSNSIEVFADEGITVISDTVFSTGSLTALSLYATGGNAVVEQLSITGRS